MRWSGRASRGIACDGYAMRAMSRDASGGKPHPAVHVLGEVLGDQAVGGPLDLLALTETRLLAVPALLVVGEVPLGRVQPLLVGHASRVPRDIACDGRVPCEVGERGGEVLKHLPLVGAERLALLPLLAHRGLDLRDDAGRDQASLGVLAQLDRLELEAEGDAILAVAVLPYRHAALGHLPLHVRRGAEAAVAAGALGGVLAAVVDDHDEAVT